MGWVVEAETGNAKSRHHSPSRTSCGSKVKLCKGAFSIVVPMKPSTARPQMSGPKFGRPMKSNFETTTRNQRGNRSSTAFLQESLMQKGTFRKLGVKGGRGEVTLFDHDGLVLPGHHHFGVPEDFANPRRPN